MRIVTIYGPPASGKTRHSQEFAKHYGCKHVVEEAAASKEAFEQMAQDGGVLVLVTVAGKMTIPDAIHINDALKAIGRTAWKD